MRDAKDLFWALLAAIPDGRKVAALFAQDGAVELPYLATLGLPWRYEGPAAIAAFYEVVAGYYPDMVFLPQDSRLLIETPDQAFGEYRARMTAATGRRIDHLFAGRLVAREGKIVLLRESLNVLAAAQALLPGGLADLPALVDEARSVDPLYRS